MNRDPDCILIEDCAIEGKHLRVANSGYVELFAQPPNLGTLSFFV